MKPNMHANAIKTVGERCRSIIRGNLEGQELTLED